MCGLLFSKNLIPEKRFKKALAEMSFRGPDANAIHVSPYAILGHNRLKIFGVDDAYNQPFFSRSKKYAIVFNGAIYNYKELSKKHRVAVGTKCDTELLVELYEKIGYRMLSELNGMFSLVILNVETGDRFVARDRLGIKPLFVSALGGNKIYSSEISPILKLLESQPAYDQVSVRQYELMRGFLGHRTLYEGIEMFPAGHYEVNGVLHSYWDFSSYDDEASCPDEEELLGLIHSSVEMRCKADVPVATYLSGGLDSSLVTALAGGLSGWSAGFPEENEFNWAKRVADHVGVKYYEKVVCAKSFSYALNDMIDKRAEPISVPNEVMIYLMTKSLGEKAKVVLSGEGADELFFGYDRIFNWSANSCWDLRSFADRYCYSEVKPKDIPMIEEILEPCMRSSAERTTAAFFQVRHLHGLLRRLDFSSMLCGVEARVPFVDHRLVERMAGVPADARIRKGEAKYPLKRLAERYLPKDIIYRKKVGFPVPLESLGDWGLGSYPEFFEYNLCRLGVR